MSGYLVWQTRWNHSRGILAMTSERGDQITHTNMLGTVDIQRNDVPHFIRQIREALDQLERTVVDDG